MRVDYFIRVRAKESVQNIKLILKPGCGSPLDYQVTVSIFFQYIGCEHKSAIKGRQENFEEHKEIAFDLPATGLFRFTIESNVGRVGTLLPGNLEKLEVKHHEAKICIKDFKFRNDKSLL